MNRVLGLLFLCAAVAVASESSRADDKEKAKDTPVVAAIRSKLKDPDKPFTVVTKIKVKDKAAGDKIEAIFKTVVPATRKEKGNLAYMVNRDTTDPTVFILYDRWANLKAVIDHENADYFKANIEEFLKQLDGPPDMMVMLPVGEEK